MLRLPACLRGGTDSQLPARLPGTERELTSRLRHERPLIRSRQRIFSAYGEPA